MANLTLRSTKGAPLTNNEVDGNFTSLNSELGGKQDILVSTLNIKSINGETILGSGNLEVTGIPQQTNNAGKYLVTNGTNAQWVDIGEFTSVTTGDITMTGAAKKFYADFSNSTIINRAFIKSSTLNGKTSVGVLPNGTSVSSEVQVLNSENPTNSSYLSIAADGTSVQLKSDRNGSGSYLPLSVLTGGVETVKIGTSGNVGFGVPTPSYKLDIAGTTPTIRIKDAGSASGVLIRQNIGGAAQILVQDTATLSLGTNNTDRVTIAPNGYVGIGSSTPVSLLSLFSPIGSTQLTIGSSDLNHWGFGRETVSGDLVIKSIESGNETEVIRFNNNGAIGIGSNFGTTGQVLISNGSNTPTWETVNTSLLVFDDNLTSTQLYPIFTSTTSGDVSDVSVSSTKLSFTPSTGELNATSFNSTSDARLKTNIENIEGALNIIEALDGKTFTYTQTGVNGAGFIAQEIQQVLPNAVSEIGEGYLGVNYDSVIPYLVEAIKELSVANKELKAEISALKGE